MTLFLVPIILMLAYFAGYSIRRGSICVVLAARTLIVDRKTARFRAFSVAAAGSGAVIVPLHWLAPEAAMLSAGYPVTVTALWAGAAFGIGAWVNGACGLGTLAHLTGGNLNFAVSILGMATGAILAVYVRGKEGLESVLRVSPLDRPEPLSVLIVLLFGAVLLVALSRRLPRWWRALQDPAGSRMGPYRSMLVFGVCGGLLYSLAGNWTYMSVLSRRAARLVEPNLLPSGWPALLVAAAVVVGGIVAAVRAGNFNLRPPTLIGGVRCLIGGTIMGASASAIPGGNATLLLHGLPSLAPHAISAYASMTFVLCALVFAVELAPDLWSRNPIDRTQMRSTGFKCLNRPGSVGDHQLK